MSKEHNNELEEVKWGGLLNEFLWMCAGANRQILRQCPTDYAKYAGIGGTILFTALMAMLSGGYAFSTVFDNAWATCGFGIFWGLLIFNLDRFMVNTMYSDGKHSISRQEFLGGLPRIILAIFLGVVISTPIEMRVFDDKIQSQLIIDQGNVGDDARKAHESLYNEQKRLWDLKQSYEAKLLELRSGSVNGTSSRIVEKEKELHEAENKLYEETYGTGITKKRGYGPAAKQLDAQVGRLKEELQKLREEEQTEKANNKDYIASQTNKVLEDIKDIDRQLNIKNEQIAQLEQERDKATHALAGFTARLKAMSEITSYSNDSMLFMARVMIMLLFIIIEVIPTLFKMMLDAGPYDNLLRAEKHRIMILSEHRISDINDHVNTEIMISTEKNKNKLEAEVAANKELLNRIALVQSELLTTAIEKWREEELRKINENPSAYIKTSSENHEK